MAQSIGGQVIFPPDLSNAKFLADMQHMEPYASQGLNRKFRNILLPGIYSGYLPSPGVGLNLLISSGADGGACSLNIKDRYQISAIQLADETILLQAGRPVTVALEVNYDGTCITDQVDQNSTISAAHLVAIDQGTPLSSNQIELCKVNIPRAATQITPTMIDMSGRIQRAVGIQLTDRVDLQDSGIAASAWAVKKAFDKVMSASGTKLGAGEYGIGAETVQVSNIDWQTYQFHGDEYIFINWSMCANNPDIDYPPGYYQISVLGLSNTDNQSLMVRPVNYLDPLAPFMISWTGDKGSRAFKTRAVSTSMTDINTLGNVTPNTLKRRSHTGVFNQPDAAQATTAKGYPVSEAGSLRLEPASPSFDGGGSPIGGIYQEYTTFLSGRKFTRRMQQDGSFAAWSEYANLSNDILVASGNTVGVKASSNNAIYLANGAQQLGGNNNAQTLANAVMFQQGTVYGAVGLMRDGSNNALGVSLVINGVERLRAAAAEGSYYGNFGICANDGAINFRSADGSALNGSIAYTNNRLLLTNSRDGSTLGLLNHGIVNGGTPIGADGALLRGTIEGGNWDEWRTKSAGLIIDMISESTAYTPIRWNLTGTGPVAGISYARYTGGGEMRLNVNDKYVSFDSNGKITAQGEIQAVSSIRVIGSGNRHLWFMNAAGTEKGLVFNDDSGNMHIRANGNKDYTFGADGTFTSVGVVRGNVWAPNTVMIGDNDSGFSARGDGAINLICNGAANGFFSAGGDFYWGQNGNFNDVWIRSDATVKRGLKRHENVFEGLRAVVGYLYEVQDGSGNWNESAGVIAQDVAKNFPGLVKRDEESGLLRLNYNGLIGVLVDAVNLLAEGK